MSWKCKSCSNKQSDSSKTGFISYYPFYVHISIVYILQHSVQFYWHILNSSKPITNFKCNFTNIYNKSYTSLKLHIKNFLAKWDNFCIFINASNSPWNCVFYNLWQLGTFFRNTILLFRLKLKLLYVLINQRATLIS